MSSVAKTASIAADQIMGTAANARAGLMDFGMQAMKFLGNVRGEEIRTLDAVLDHLGLQRRQSAIRPALLFLSGAVLAGSFALVLAPTTGKKLRTRIAELFAGAKVADGASMSLQTIKNGESRTDAVAGGLSDASPSAPNGV